MSKKSEIMQVLSKELGQLLSKMNLEFAYLQEIRLRINEPMAIVYQDQEWFIREDGAFCNSEEGTFIVTSKMLKDTLEQVCHHSIYAFEEDMRQGFITVFGGHRVGVTGKTVIVKGEISQMKHISFMNIRISHEIIGCGRQLCSYVVENDQVLSTLILAPPRAGKTTVLRDLIRIISKGEGLARGYTVGLVDERSEIAACYQGIPQNDLGPRVDVLDCCPKSEGMNLLLRSMSPEVIAVDEIGGSKDLEALKNAANCGCALLATVHANSLEGMWTRPLIHTLQSQRLFQRYVVLNKKHHAGEIDSIYDGMGNCLFSKRRGAIHSCAEQVG